MEHLGYTSAALLIGGGLFGFRRGSRASLIGGTALAAALAGAATATKKSEHVGAAAAAAAAVGGLCFAVGAKRWSQVRLGWTGSEAEAEPDLAQPRAATKGLLVSVSSLRRVLCV